MQRLEERAFCYDAPADFRAGAEAMARGIEAWLHERDLAESEDGQASAGRSERAG